MKQKLVLVFIGLFLFSLAGCRSQAPTAPGSQPQKIKVLLDWVPNTNHAGLYIAKDQGYYAQEGLDVEIVQPPEGGAAQLIASGQADFAVSYQEEVTMARAQNLPLLAIAAVIQHNSSGFASPQSKNIKTPLDFQGKTYGGWGSPSETAMLKALMKKYGGDVNRINIVNIGTADFFTSVQKDVDFSWIFYGWTGIEAEQKGLKLNFIPLDKEDPAFDFYTPVLIASEKTASSNPQMVERFMKATSRGYLFAVNNPDAASNIMVKAVPELNASLVNASLRYLAPRFQADAPRWGEMKKSTWDAYTAFLVENGLLAQGIDSDKAFTNRFLPAK
ncbi:MAG: ABC transporter substrate-binding protein [Syntrophomonadaceae bacterium]